MTDMRLPYRLITAVAVVGLICPELAAAHTESHRSPPVSPWKETGLDIAVIERTIANQRCHDSRSAFVSCLNAIQAILDHSPHRLRVAASTATGSSAVDAVARFGTVSIVRQSEEGDLAPRQVRDIIEERQRRLASWRVLHSAQPRGGGEPVDFGRLTRWLVNEVVDPEHVAELAAAAVNGFLGVADAHARIMPATLPPWAGDGLQESDDASISHGALPHSEAFDASIGVGLHRIARYLLVAEIVLDGPAARAGLQPHDVILEIDGLPVPSVMPAEQAMQVMHGLAGSTVTLTAQRGSRTLRLPIVRERMSPSVARSAIIDDDKRRWGHLRILSFLAPHTCEDVRRELRSVLREGVDGLVLDLRDNMGGLIDQAVCVADMFLRQGLVVMHMRTRSHRGQTQRMHSRSPMLTRLPIATLVNSRTGSASEVLAGALQDYGRTVVIGERTYGKGTVQSVRPWNSSGSILRLFTAGRYYLPSGRSVQRVGLEPDLPIAGSSVSDLTQKVVLRERDMFPNALPAASRRSARRQPALFAALRSCVARLEGKGPRSVPGQVRAALPPDDRRLRYAQNALSCLRGS